MRVEATTKAVNVNVRPWFSEVKVGQKLRPVPLWNQTERGPNQLPDQTEILDIEESVSQSGIVFKVRSIGGSVQLLDAGWFELPKI